MEQNTLKNVNIGIPTLPFTKPCLHRRENNKYFSLPLAMAIWGDRKSSIKIASLGKIARLTSNVYMSL
jgi:hypothetical protein